MSGPRSVLGPAPEEAGGLERGEAGDDVEVAGHPPRAVALGVGFGRIVASEMGVPNLSVNLVE